MDLGAKAHVGMTYEPALADGSLAGARKGSGNFSLRCRGRAAHAGREHHLGRNAIVAAADFARGLDLLNGQRPDITFNVSRIDGGGAPNVVPDLGICRFNVRVKTEEDTPSGPRPRSRNWCAPPMRVTGSPRTFTVVSRVRPSR
jgi:glutamate carboxypeptidase